MSFHQEDQGPFVASWIPQALGTNLKAIGCPPLCAAYRGSDLLIAQQVLQGVMPRRWHDGPHPSFALRLTSSSCAT